MSHEVLIAFVAFIASLIVCHGLLLTLWKNQSERFWKAMDYPWFLVAVISLWGVAERYEQQEKNRRIQALVSSLEREYGAQQSWILALMNNSLRSAILTIEENPNKDQFIRKEVLEPLHAQFWYADLQLKLSNYRPYSQHREKLKIALANIASKGLIGKMVANDGETFIERAIQDEQELDDLRAASADSAFGQMVMYWFPYFLAVGLGLRITRITAEVFVLKKPCPAPVTPVIPEPDKVKNTEQHGGPAVEITNAAPTAGAASPP